MKAKEKPLDELLRHVENRGGNITAAELLSIIVKNDLAIVRRKRREQA